MKKRRRTPSPGGGEKRHRVGLRWVRSRRAPNRDDERPKQGGLKRKRRAGERTKTNKKPKPDPRGDEQPLQSPGFFGDDNQLPHKRHPWRVKLQPKPRGKNGKPKPGGLKRKHSGGERINDSKRPKRGGTGPGNTPRHEMTSAGPPATSPNKKYPGPEAEHGQPSGPRGREGQASDQDRESHLERMLTPPPEDGTRLPNRSCLERRITDCESGGGIEPRPGRPKRERDGQGIDVSSALGTGEPDLQDGNQLHRKRKRNDRDDEIDRGRSKLPRLGFGGEQQPESSEVRVDNNGEENSDRGPSDQDTPPIEPSGKATSPSTPGVQDEVQIKDTRSGPGQLGKLTQITKTLFFQPLVNFLKTPINPLSRWFARRRK